MNQELLQFHKWYLYKESWYFSIYNEDFGCSLACFWLFRQKWCLKRAVVLWGLQKVFVHVLALLLMQWVIHCG